MAGRSVISGRVVDIVTGAGIASLRIEALDVSGSFRDLLGYAVTDADGRFRMEVQSADLTTLVGQRRVTAYLRVIHEPQAGIYHVLADTQHSGPRWSLDGRATEVAFEVSTDRVLSQLPSLSPFVVSGTVHDRNGPIAAVRVTLRDRDPLTGDPLDWGREGDTDARGRYRIAYEPRTDKGLRNLYVVVSTDPETVTDTRCHAPPALVVNAVMTGHAWRGATAYAGTVERLQAAGVTSLGTLTAEQTERLSCALHLPVSDVTAVATAHAIRDASRLSFDSPVHHVFFAGLARGLGTDRATFLQHPRSAVKAAVIAAANENQIALDLATPTSLGSLMTDWARAAAEWSLEARSSPCGLGELLTVAGVSGEDRSSFAQQLCSNESAMPDFWDNLTGAFDKPRLQLTLQWWSLARGHFPLIQELESRRAAGTAATLADLARLSKAEWLDIVGSLVPSTPPDVPGRDEAERIDNYAHLLHLTMATAFPTHAFRTGAAANGSEIVPFVTFFSQHPTFEFGKKRLSHPDYGASLDAMTPLQRKRIKAMERVIRFAPTYESVDALLLKGYDSAHSIRAAGKKKFLADMQGSLGDALAHEILTKACWQVTAATTVFAQFGRVSHRLPMKVLANIGQISPQLQNDIPDWQTLFGNPGGCSCKHCASVLGPAAYLADSLVWLDGFPSEVEKNDTERWSALDILVGSSETGAQKPAGRRPDLPLLELTCKSAHTPQPYIDLTNELLELAVAKDAGFPVDLGTAIKSSYEPEELAAGPEILYETPHLRAWRSLMERRHPFTLPACLFDREAEAYLRYLGVSRADIVETLGGTGDELAKARLGVRDDAHSAPDDVLLSGWKMLIGTDPGTVQEHWGVKAEDTNSLRLVPTFLKHAGLSFTELVELLATRWVNGADGAGAAGLLPLVLESPPGHECDQAFMTLPALGDDHLSRLHRFLRLRLHTGLSSTDLDLLLAAFPANTGEVVIDEALLRKITDAQALARELSLTVREVAGLFADLDTHERWEKKSPYRQYFLNRLVDSPEPTEFSSVLEASLATADLTTHRTALQQALGIGEKELSLLVDAASLSAELLLPSSELVLSGFAPATQLAILPSVSTLWRHVRFARALGLKLSDYVAVKSYSGMAPIGAGATPADASHFVDLVRAWKAQKLTVTDLQWILRAFAPASGSSVPDAADIEALRSELTSAVGAIVSETEAAEDLADTGTATADSRTRASALLAALLGTSQRDAILAVLRGSESPPNDGSFRDPIGDLDVYLPGNANDVGGAKDLLAGPYTGGVQQPPLLGSAAERFAYVAKWLDRHVRASRAVEEKLAAATKLPIATVRFLMTGVLKSEASPWLGHYLLADFLPPNKPQSTPELQARGIALVMRQARLITALGVADPIPPAPDAPPSTENPGEVLWLYADSTGLLHSLPAQQPVAGAFGADERARFGKILQIARRVALRDRMTGGAAALRELLDAWPPAFEDAKSLLVEQSGWERAAIDALCPVFSISDTAGLLADDNLLKLERAIALIRRLGIEGSRVLAFVNLETPPPLVAEGGLQPTAGGPPNARDLVIFARHAAKAKLSAEEWGLVAKKVRDPFRELLRDRLVDALVPKLHATRDDLYGFHLIDVDMSACMMTSRIVQATNAMQVFVQRSFLGLDDDVKLPTEATKQWEWRKAYRVWEANRKVFLWPENWLEPDLRDDMTPLFREFLTHLASGEITDESAERALEKYLSGLHEIARLEPMGHFYDYDSDTDHVIARTRSQPRKWFYRRREGGVWTPWEKMDLDIDAESLLLVGANRRLYLFWPQLTIKNDRKELIAPEGGPPHPGQPPLPELGEPWGDWLDRFKKWGEALAAWAAAAKDNPPVEAESEKDEEPKQHYEVRVAWSSYRGGAWTPKRMSDCPPITVAGARGETAAGYEPRHILFVLHPELTEPAPGILRLLCVAAPWSENMKTARVGRFYFDACDGGRWTSKQLSGSVYNPTSPTDSRLSALGFEQFGGSGAIEVQHIPVGGLTAAPVKLLSKHEGRFFIVTPSSSSANPTHAFDRFLFADHKAVFHGRALRTGESWPLPAISFPGQPAPAKAPGDEGSASDPVTDWSLKLHLQIPLESVDRYALDIFEHPYVCEFANRLAAHGVSGLLGWQGEPGESAQYLEEPIEHLYDPGPRVADPFPKHDVSFEIGSTYGMYNWELFFHAPFTIAQRLSQEGRYAEAQKWYHYIFNPTTGLSGGAERFWCVKPFHEIHDLSTIEQSLADLAAASSFGASLHALVSADEATENAAEELKKQIAAMAEHPFAPHVLARMRPLAYMKNVFMRYVQNLLDWGDSLFRRDTMESVHEALTLYLLAADLLGAPPETIKHEADPAGKTFEQLVEAGIDEFGNAAVEVETIVPRFPPRGFKCAGDGPPIPDFRLYFCVPPNDQLRGLWDTVADRLFKIRNCMNIEGVARSLALFAPPIDPAILVRAFAAGVRLDQVLDSLAGPAPLYRFVRLHAKAVEFASAVQSLGQALLAALEKKDGEELALLRQRHELAVLDAEREIRKHAIQEARETLSGLHRSRGVAETRLQYYTGLIEKGLIGQEKDAEKNTRDSRDFRQHAAEVDAGGAMAALIPDILMGAFPGSQIGGRAVQLASSAVARRLSFEGDSLNTDASLAQTSAGYARRAQEWKLQKSLAEKEITQHDKQIAAQEIRVAMAERELENLDLRRDHSREVDAFFRTKFANQDLYTWMSTQLASEHYRAYQTAYDMAKKAERAYQLERGDETSFIRFGAWDSLKKGLLAGERLLSDLRALDAAYLSRSDRERELTKHISLAEVAGEELTRLRDEGVAEIELHTHHFDADYPGHYFRRIKSVAISVATVLRSADTVQCELTLLKSSYRHTSKVGDTPYPGDPYADAPHRYSTAVVKALATSTGENDPGLFELSLKDEMLLPVEGSGVVSQWRIDIDPKTNRFPMHRIRDVVLHLRYTAKDAGAGLRGQALAYAESASGLRQRTRVFSARRDFDEAWSAFVAGALLDNPAGTWVNQLELRFAREDFQSFFGDPKVKIVKVQVSATFNEKHLPDNPTGKVSYELIEPDATPHDGTLDFRAGEPKDGIDSLSVSVPRGDDDPFLPWIFRIAASASTPDPIRLGAPGHDLLKPDAFEDIWFIVTYERQ